MLAEPAQTAVDPVIMQVGKRAAIENTLFVLLLSTAVVVSFKVDTVFVVGLAPGLEVAAVKPAGVEVHNAEVPGMVGGAAFTPAYAAVGFIFRVCAFPTTQKMEAIRMSTGLNHIEYVYAHKCLPGFLNKETKVSV